jgi:hypothetical protein
MKDVWASSVSADMANGLTKKELEQLVEELDDAVMRICQDFGIEG